MGAGFLLVGITAVPLGSPQSGGTMGRPVPCSQRSQSLRDQTRGIAGMKFLAALQAIEACFLRWYWPRRLGPALHVELACSLEGHGVRPARAAVCLDSCEKTETDSKELVWCAMARKSPNGGSGCPETCPALKRMKDKTIRGPSQCYSTG
ncbi:hypothetical protein GQ53DRAFT_325153 [Thozetella sp. PMI_491]|nr:hypothetical protein GQ53DRAFT_325153 [Thozetella sp. PMI_491]